MHVCVRARERDIEKERERETKVEGMHKVNDSHVLELGMSGRPAVSEYPDAHAAQCKAG